MDALTAMRQAREALRRTVTCGHNEHECANVRAIAALDDAIEQIESIGLGQWTTPRAAIAQADAADLSASGPPAAEDIAEASGGREGGPEEDRIEAAYWKFDARRSGYGQWKSAPMSERDAFKAELRNALAAEKVRAEMRLVARGWRKPPQITEDDLRAMLPEPTMRVTLPYYDGRDQFYTADQMLDYGRAVAARRGGAK